MNPATLTVLAMACYMVAVACYGGAVFLRHPAGTGSAPIGAGRFGRPLLVAGAALQFAAIGVSCVTQHHSPFASFFGTMSVTAWAIALSCAVLDVRYRMPAVEGLALLVASLVIFWGLTRAGETATSTPLLHGLLVSLHVLAFVASLGMFVVAFVCAGLYILQNRLLRERHTPALFRNLPPLATLDSVAYHAVAFGLPLLTIGLALGIARVFGGGLNHPPAVWLRDTKTIASFATWCVYLFYVLLRLAAGWRGVRLQYVLLVGFVFAVALYAMPTTTHMFPATRATPSSSPLRPPVATR